MEKKYINQPNPYIQQLTIILLLDYIKKYRSKRAKRKREAERERKNELLDFRGWAMRQYEKSWHWGQLDVDSCTGHRIRSLADVHNAVDNMLLKVQEQRNENLRQDAMILRLEAARKADMFLKKQERNKEATSIMNWRPLYGIYFVNF
jgi:hypothetical protein